MTLMKSRRRDRKKVKGFIKSGGVTVSGGEPLMQTKFVLELFKNVKKRIFTPVGIPMVICSVKKSKSVLEITDLVLLDIKHIDPENI